MPAYSAIRLSRGACLGWALMLLLLPLQLCAGLFLAAAVHEAGHIAALRLQGIRIRQLRVGFFGAVLETEPMAPGQELLCALAGPGAGAAVLLFSRLLPWTALCAMGQTVFNLLPVYPLDGGRAIRAGSALLREKYLDLQAKKHYNSTDQKEEVRL